METTINATGLPVDTYVVSSCSKERNDSTGQSGGIQELTSVRSPVARNVTTPPGKPVAFQFDFDVLSL